MSYKKTKSYKAFMGSPYRSIKHESYFSVYDTLLKEYIGKDIIFFWCQKYYKNYNYANSLK